VGWIRKWYNNPLAYCLNSKPNGLFFNIIIPLVDKSKEKVKEMYYTKINT